MFVLWLSINNLKTNESILYLVKQWCSKPLIRVFSLLKETKLSKMRTF